MLTFDTVNVQVAITKRTEPNTSTALFSGFEFPLGGRLLEVRPILPCTALQWATLYANTVAKGVCHVAAPAECAYT